ncbi:cation-transporting P-type ATPase [Sedimentimonas flavescens]|uniref:Cation-transporting P-type ATPase n=1 Tax=Sedimentimonas flavescens TaxID=2851012 RepID=A0ABT3A0S3_9RHOB|nr:cation-transporting P-type ATPase [Sedimentimonas flavescens]MCV2879596.1 cation-transporting P-type ATPase [Sedimentimonas flavescens]
MHTHSHSPPYASSPEEQARLLGTDAGTGLAPEDAAARLSTHGPNALRRQKPKSVALILRHQFASVIVWLLAGAAAISFLWRDVAEGVAIIIVLLINGIIGFVTELRAARSMEKLIQLSRLHARVRRGGKERMIDAYDLVPGDIVVLEPGDVVPADLRLAAVSSLEADESVLTGESHTVTKSIEAVGSDAVLGDRFCMAYQGTAITKGTGEGIVIATGMDTEIGQISEMVQSASGEVAPLERRLDMLGRKLVWLTVSLALLTIGAGILRGFDIATMIQIGVALAVAAVPEGLPVVATLSLARGLWRMSARNALIRQLSSVETLGATTVILTDKTGTLTENRMTVVGYLLDGLDVTLGTQDDAAAFEIADERLAWALRVGALCNTAEAGDGPSDERAGDPMELALIAAARDAGIDRADLRRRYPELTEHAFDPARKMMAMVLEDGRHHLVAVKGAAEEVMALCTRVFTAEGAEVALEDAARQDWQRRITGAAHQGLRLLALAMKRVPGAGVDPYGDLTLIGLVCLRDPIRADVSDAVRASRTAGVRVVMVTGDHADTARAIASAAGLGDGALEVIDGSALRGIDLDTMSDEMRARILRADVFARLDPATKLTLVSVYQRAGHVVAMTGDGVNDAPALKKADIGIAMGLRGTEVAKEAAHMILRDDAFSTVIAAMRQGRVIFQNIRQFVIYLMSCNVSEVLVVGLAVGGGLPVPLLPLQILYLNLVTDIFPAFALGLGAGNEQVMSQPPRDPKEPIIARPHWWQIAVLGGSITLATLLAFGLALFALELAPAPSVTVAFVTLALAQIWNVFNVRDPSTNALNNAVTRNPYVWGAIALCLGLVALALWQPLLADILRLDPPGKAGLGLAVAMSLVPLVIGQIWIRWMPGARHRTGRGGQ